MNIHMEFGLWLSVTIAMCLQVEAMIRRYVCGRYKLATA